MVCRAASEGAASLHRRGRVREKEAGGRIDRKQPPGLLVPESDLLSCPVGIEKRQPELWARAPPCLQEPGQQDRSLAGLPLPTSSVLDSGLGQVHPVTEAVTPPPLPPPRLKPCSGNPGAGFQLSHPCRRGKCTRETLQGTLSEAICSRSRKNTGAASLTIEAPSFWG